MEFKFETKPVVSDEAKKEDEIASESQDKKSGIPKFLSGKYADKMRALLLATALTAGLSSDESLDLKILHHSENLIDTISSRGKVELVNAFKSLRNNKGVDPGIIEVFFAKDDPKKEVKKSILVQYLMKDSQAKWSLDSENFLLFIMEANRFKKDGNNFLKEIFDLVYPREVRQRLMVKIKNEDPKVFIRYCHAFEDLPDAKKIMDQTVKDVIAKEPSYISDLRGYQRHPYTEDDYSETIKMISEIRDPEVGKIIRAIDEIEYAVNGGKEYLSTLFDSSYFALIDDVVRGRISSKDVPRIENTPELFFKRLIDIKKNPNHIGDTDVDRALRKISLKFAKEINDLHEQNNLIRFKSVENLNAEEIYMLMVYGEEEVYTSTFTGLFDRFLAKIQSEKLSGDKFLSLVGHANFRTFIKECASYDRLEEFLETMDINQRNALLQKFIAEVGDSDDILKEATIIADTISAIKGKELIDTIGEVIKNEYGKNRYKAEETKLIYSLLLGMFYENKTTEDDWLREISNKYKLADLDMIREKSLFDKNGKNVQQYYFYNDGDGRGSFDSFISRYKDDSEWNLEKNGSFVVIKSKDVKGRNIEIYANFPEHEEGIQEIKTLLDKRKIDPSVVVHRGHSYHVDKTINSIDRSASFVYLGSCGGYNNLSKVLGKASSAKILGTKGQGTMNINDPLLKMLNQDILEKGSINWPEFWGRAEKKFAHDNRFKSYVPPHKNLSALFIAAYNNLKASDKK